MKCDSVLEQCRLFQLKFIVVLSLTTTFLSKFVLCDKKMEEKIAVGCGGPVKYKILKIIEVAQNSLPSIECIACYRAIVCIIAHEIQKYFQFNFQFSNL